VVVGLGGWTAPAAASSGVSLTGADWPQFQGSGSHAGVAATLLPPPLKRLWWFHAPRERSGLSGVVVVGGTAIALGEHGVYGVDATSGSARWTVDRNGGPICEPAVGEAGGRLLLVYTEGDRRNDSAVVGVDLATQHELWRRSLQSVSASGVTVDGATAFLGDRAGRLYAFDLATGAPAKWSPEPLVAGVIDAPPAASAGQVFAVTRNPDTNEVHVLAVNGSSGKVLWDHAPSFAAGTGTAVGTSGDHVFFGLGSEQRTHALARLTGIEDWSARSRDTFSPWSSPAVADGRLFITSTSTSKAVLYAFDAATGTKQWDFQFQEAAIRSSPVVAGRTAYLGLEDGRVVAIDIPSGLEVWEDHTGSGAMGPLALAGDELVASKRGSRGGLIAFGPNPSGRLLRVESPTVLHLGGVLARYGLAFVAVFVAAFGTALLLRRRASGASGRTTAPIETGPPSSTTAPEEA
jgi:outer membrane protein assembly factor BamB